MCSGSTSELSSVLFLLSDVFFPFIAASWWKNKNVWKTFDNIEESSRKSWSREWWRCRIKCLMPKDFVDCLCLLHCFVPLQRLHHSRFIQKAMKYDYNEFFTLFRVRFSPDVRQQQTTFHSQLKLWRILFHSPRLSTLSRLVVNFIFNEENLWRIYHLSFLNILELMWRVHDVNFLPNFSDPFQHLWGLIKIMWTSSVDKRRR